MKSLPRYQPELKPLIDEAAAAYRRRDDEAFRDLLERAWTLAPWRLDLGFNLAHHFIQTGAPEKALEIYRQIGILSPSDAEAQLSLAHWLRYFGHTEEAEAARRRLAETRPAQAVELRHIWGVIDHWLATPVSDGLPLVYDSGPELCLVVLGYVLDADGSMANILVGRLETARALARVYPDSLILVSGGMPRAGKVEAREMRDWLVERGVHAERILEDGYSRDVLENAVYSRQILDLHAVSSVVIATSPIDYRRAGVVFELVGWTGGSGWTVEAVVASRSAGDVFVDDGRDKLKLYRDALRAYGILMMRTFPELAER